MNHSLFLYSPSDFFSMDASNQAMIDRYNGVFAPLEISADAFKTAYDTSDIGPHIEKDYKGLSYLSWPFAFRYLKEHFPTLFVAFEEKTLGWPVFGEPGAFILRPYLTDGIRRTPALVFPVMDRKHNSIQQLDGRAISDNIQRASVKCIATFTGLGLRLYAGEDIPKEDDAKKQTRLPLQQEAQKQDPPSKQDAPAAGSSVSDAGTTGTPAFNAKEALTALCKANPLGYADERTSMAAGKAALESVGFSRATEIKSWDVFCNVSQAMITLWAKEQGLAIPKGEMKAELDAIAASSNVEETVKAIKAFAAKKQ